MSAWWADLPPSRRPKAELLSESEVDEFADTVDRNQIVGEGDAEQQAKRRRPAKRRTPGQPGIFRAAFAEQELLGVGQAPHDRQRRDEPAEQQTTTEQVFSDHYSDRLQCAC